MPPICVSPHPLDFVLKRPNSFVPIMPEKVMCSISFFIYIAIAITVRLSVTPYIVPSICISMSIFVGTTRTFAGGAFGFVRVETMSSGDMLLVPRRLPSMLIRDARYETIQSPLLCVWSPMM